MRYDKKLALALQYQNLGVHTCTSGSFVLWAHIVPCVNPVFLIKHLIVLAISCLELSEWELIPSYGMEVIFHTYSFMKTELKQERGEKQVKERVCVVSYTNAE